MRFNDLALKHYSKLEGYTKRGRLSYKTAKDEERKERWFMLKGNLLFYYRIFNNALPLKIDSEPIGVFVLEDCAVQMESNVFDSAQFSITFKSELKHSFFGTKVDCVEWVTAISSANIKTLQVKLQELCSEITRRTGQNPLKKILDAKLTAISKQKAIGRSMFVHVKTAPDVTSISQNVRATELKVTSNQLLPEKNKLASNNDFLLLDLSSENTKNTSFDNRLLPEKKSNSFMPSNSNNDLALIDWSSHKITNTSSNSTDYVSAQNNSLLSSNRNNVFFNLNPDAKLSEWESFD